MFYLGLLRLDLVDRVAALAVKEKAKVLASLGDGDDVWEGGRQDKMRPRDRKEQERRAKTRPPAITSHP